MVCTIAGRHHFANPSDLKYAIWVRRARLHARTFLDDYTAMNAIAGLVIGTNSLIITILNTNWRLPEDDEEVAKFKRDCHEPSALDLFVELMQPNISFVEIRTSALLGTFLQCAALFSLEYSSTFGSFAKRIHFASLRSSIGRGSEAGIYFLNLSISNLE